MYSKKIMKDAWHRYCNSNHSELYEVYGNYSISKAKIFEECKRLMYAYHGIDMRIIGHNCHFFTCGFMFEDENGEYMFMYITPSNYPHGQSISLREVD